MRLCPHRVGEQVDFTTTDNPNTLWPSTTWTQVEGSFSLASSSSHSLGTTGGSETVTLTEAEMPSHTHIQNSHNHTQNPHKHTYYFDKDSSVDWFIGLNSGSVQSDRSAIASGPQGRGYTMGINNTTATNVATTAVNQSTGGNNAHNNMPPYITVNRWKRVA